MCITEGRWLGIRRRDTVQGQRAGEEGSVRGRRTFCFSTCSNSGRCYQYVLALSEGLSCQVIWLLLSKAAKYNCVVAGKEREKESGASTCMKHDTLQPTHHGGVSIHVCSGGRALSLYRNSPGSTWEHTGEGKTGKEISTNS